MSDNKITVQFTNDSIAQIDKNLMGLGSELQNKVMSKAIYDSIDPVLDSAKQAVPVKTGALRDSLAKRKINEFDKPGARIIARRIGKGGYHANLIEYGHRIVVRGGRTIGVYPAHPFMRDSLTKEADGVVTRVGQKVAEAVAKFKGG